VQGFSLRSGVEVLLLRRKARINAPFPFEIAVCNPFERLEAEHNGRTAEARDAAAAAANLQAAAEAQLEAGKATIAQVTCTVLNRIHVII
jgi:hypothetical protein